MHKKLILLSVFFFAVLFVGAGCNVPGEKSVINGNYLEQTKPTVAGVPVEPALIATSTASSSR